MLLNSGYWLGNHESGASAFGRQPQGNSWMGLSGFLPVSFARITFPDRASLEAWFETKWVGS
jgi:hypothetical protein